MSTSLSSSNIANTPQFDREAVLLQTERLLTSPHFRTSRRYPAFLRYVVQQTLDGHADTLKERTLGVEIFEREPSFDTAGDSIVRVAAAEVRKRIAQYYQEEGHEDELRIDLPSGSYVPRFRLPYGPIPEIVAEPETAAASQTDRTERGARTRSFSSRHKKLAWAAAALLLIAIAALIALRGRSDNGMNRFWGPVFASSSPVLVCVGTVEPSHLGLDKFTAEMANNVNAAQDSLIPIPPFRDWPAVSWADALGMSRITELLTRREKTFQLRSSDSVTLADLRNGPVIMLGVLENSWSLRLASKLRFHPRMDDATQKMWIEDSQHPERTDWSYPWGMKYSGSREDYALITRVRNPLSGQISVEIGGLGLHASKAASEFVTKPVYLNSLSSSLRDPNRSVQIVLRVNVINGEPGPPQIVAEYYW
jgi:hypothetical protein